MIDDLEQNFEDYDTAAIIADEDFTDGGEQDFAKVEDYGGQRYGQIGEMYVPIGATPIVEDPQPLPMPQEPESNLGKLETFINAPFSGLARGVASVVGNTAGALGLIDQKDVDAFFNAMNKMSDEAGENNPAAMVLDKGGALVGQYVAPAVTGFNALRALGVGRVASSIIAESMVGFFGISPNDETIFNNISEDTDSPAFKTLRDFLATDPNDNEYVNRAKHAADALIMLGGSEAVVRGFISAAKGTKEFLKTPQGQEVLEFAEQAGSQADARLAESMGGSKLSVNPIGAAGDMAVSAVGKAAGKIASIRQKQIPPSKPAPTTEALQTARNDTRKSADIVRDRLDIIVPESERVTGGTYIAGRPDGSDWTTLTPEELAVRGPGFTGTDETLERIWQETLSETSAAGREAVQRTGANWSAFKAADWDAALKLPLRSQLWYELSGEKFIKNLPGLNQQEHMMFLDLIGATSARAKPAENLERALAVLSQRLRGVPVDVDVTIQSTVADALRRGGTEVSSDLANKTGMFSDTLALTAGIPVRYPISVNDVWVGRAFGIEDAEMSANQSLHEVFGKYMNKLRDVVNDGIGDNSGHYPHQSWNLQARQWVQLRAADEGIDTSKGAEIEGSDYAGEWGGIVKKLEDAGISVPGGIITRDILVDPRVADALRKTTPAFRQAPKATVEFGTLLTPNGKRGAELFEAARKSGDDLTQKEYLKLLTTTMYKSGRGKPTLWEKTVRVATGGSDKVTRIYSPTAEDPFAISGTFEGAAAPNIRVPLKDMTPDQIAYFNAMVGQGLKQKAMAAAQVRRIVPGEALKDGEVATSSIRFDWNKTVPEELIIGISRALGDGFEISTARYPDGIVVDVNPRFGDAGPEGPDADAIDAAIEFLLESHNVKNIKAFPSAYKSEFGKNYVEDAGDGKEYRRILKETLKGWEDGAATKIVELTGGGISKATAVKFLRGKSVDDKGKPKLNVSTADLQEGIKISSVRGRAATIRKTLQRRLSDHYDAEKFWKVEGKNLDTKMGEAIPRWERRATKLATKQNPPTEAGFSLIE